MDISQADQILTHIQTKGEITPLEALELYGCFRLGARIWDLKKRGVPIKTSSVTKNGKTFASYSIDQGGPHA